MATTEELVASLEIQVTDQGVEIASMSRAFWEQQEASVVLIAKLQADLEEDQTLIAQIGAELYDLRNLADTYHDTLDTHIHEERTIRRRIHGATSVKGVKKLEHTVETTGYSREEAMAEWDAQDFEVESRQPKVTE